MGSTEKRCTPSSNGSSGIWRVAARPDPHPFALWTRRWCGPSQLPNRTRVSFGTRGLPGLDVGEVAPPTPRHRDQFRMWRPFGPARAPRHMPSFWSTPKQSDSPRTQPRPCVSGSRSDCPGERQTEGHECCGPRRRRVASGLPLHHGAQLAVDLTLCSATSGDGLPQPYAARTNGAIFVQARTDKEAKYAELVANSVCFFVVVALETGGLWSAEAIEFIGMMAPARARGVLPVFRCSVHLAWRRRWTRMLAVSCALSFANSLVTLCLGTWSGADGGKFDSAVARRLVCLSFASCDRVVERLLRSFRRVEKISVVLHVLFQLCFFVCPPVLLFVASSAPLFDFIFVSFFSPICPYSWGVLVSW